MSELYEKSAFVQNALAGSVIRGGIRAAPAVGAIGRGALNFGRGLMGLPGAQGASRGAQMAHNAGVGAGALNTAKGIYDTVRPPEPPQAPPGVRPGMKVGTVEDRLEALVRAKVAFGVTDGIDTASYAAMIGAKFVPHDNPWHAALEGAGLLGLAGTTLAGMVGDPQARKPGIKDLIGLGLFGSALYDRMNAHHKEGSAKPSSDLYLGLAPPT